MKFRNINISEIESVLEIYNYYIINGFSNFEEKPLSNKNFIKIFNDIIGSDLPFIVCEKNNQILGFTYLNKFRNKSGYRFSFENSIYVHHNYLGKGIGNKLLKELIKKSKKNKKIKSIVAVIGNKNAIASIRIHKNNGFNMIGTLKEIGFKQNQWIDSIYMQKILNEKN